MLRAMHIGFAAALASLFALPAHAENQMSPSKASIPIVDVQMGAPTYFDAGGDSWDPTWSQDDELYSAVNDGAGFGTLKRNIGFNRISGNDPRTLTGQLQNIMDEYGEMNAPIATDGSNWKSGGSISIDGALYMSVGNGSLCRCWLRRKADAGQREHHQIQGPRSKLDKTDEG